MIVLLHRNVHVHVSKSPCAFKQVFRRENASSAELSTAP